MLKPFLLVTSLLWIPGCLSAGVLYSNLGAGFPGDSPGNDSIFSFSQQTYYFGMPFTTTAGGSLSSILVDILSDEGLPTPSAGLYTNSSGEPGTELESWSVSVPSASSVTTLYSVLNPSLSPGTVYWFVFTLPMVNGSDFTWKENDESVDGGPWSSLSSVNSLLQANAELPDPGIEVNSVPEPATGAMLAFGALVLSLCGRRRATSGSASAKL
jgi:hypothetical protein